MWKRSVLCVCVCVCVCVCAYRVLRSVLSVHLCLCRCSNSMAHWACAHFKPVPKFTCFKAEHTGELKYYKLWVYHKLCKSSLPQNVSLMWGVTDRCLLDQTDFCCQQAWFVIHIQFSHRGSLFNRVCSGILMNTSDWNTAFTDDLYTVNFPHIQGQDKILKLNQLFFILGLPRIHF